MESTGASMRLSKCSVNFRCFCYHSTEAENCEARVLAWCLLVGRHQPGCLLIWVSGSGFSSG